MLVDRRVLTSCSHGHDLFQFHVTTQIDFEHLDQLVGLLILKESIGMLRMN